MTMDRAPLGIKKDVSLYDATDRARINSSISLAGEVAARIFTAKMPVVEANPQDNMLFLASEQHGNLALSKARTRLQGGTGAVVIGTVALSSQSTIIGIDFQQATLTNLVTLNVNSRTVFTNCTFTNKSNLVPSLITCVAGAKASFIGCTFYGTGLTQVVDNPGVITDIVLLGCYNATGVSAGNVTEIGGV